LNNFKAVSTTPERRNGDQHVDRVGCQPDHQKGKHPEHHKQNAHAGAKRRTRQQRRKMQVGEMGCGDFRGWLEVPRGFQRDQRDKRAARNQCAQFVLEQLHHVEGFFEKCRHCGSDEVFAKTQAEDEKSRAPEPRMTIPGKLRTRGFCGVEVAPSPHRAYAKQWRDCHSGDLGESLCERHAGKQIGRGRDLMGRGYSLGRALRSLILGEQHLQREHKADGEEDSRSHDLEAGIRCNHWISTGKPIAPS
jgi:hypothetical protein